jgi:hypothetical protein
VRVMTGKEQMMAASRGEPVDRVPIWLREGFDFHLPAQDAEKEPDAELLRGVCEILAPVHNRTWSSGLPENQDD